MCIHNFILLLYCLEYSSSESHTVFLWKNNHIPYHNSKIPNYSALNLAVWLMWNELCTLNQLLVGEEYFETSMCGVGRFLEWHLPHSSVSNVIRILSSWRVPAKWLCRHSQSVKVTYSVVCQLKIIKPLIEGHSDSDICSGCVGTHFKSIQKKEKQLSDIYTSTLHAMTNTEQFRILTLQQSLQISGSKLYNFTNCLLMLTISVKRTL